MKSYLFEAQIFDGHVIIKDEENTILIDTGSPTTIHKRQYFQFCFESYECLINPLGLTSENLSKMVGMEITTLLGVDILSKYNVKFDYRHNEVSFSKGDFSFAGKEIDIESFMSIPIIELSIDYKTMKFFLDTGAKISYLSKIHLKNYKSIGKEKDFYHNFGTFTTECFQVKALFENEEFNVIFGILPPKLHKSLLVGGIDGIIGYDFFKNFTILLDLCKKKINYIKNKD